MIVFCFCYFLKSSSYTHFAPVSCTSFPAGHFLQSVEPVFGAKKVFGHDLQELNPGLAAKVPFGHGLHFVSSAGENCPGGQFLQSPLVKTPLPARVQSQVCPSDLFLRLPPGQLLHVVAVPPALVWLAGHRLQNRTPFLNVKRNSPGLQSVFPTTPFDVKNTAPVPRSH